MAEQRKNRFSSSLQRWSRRWWKSIPCCLHCQQGEARMSKVLGEDEKEKRRRSASPAALLPLAPWAAKESPSRCTKAHSGASNRCNPTRTRSGKPVDRVARPLSSSRRIRKGSHTIFRPLHPADKGQKQTGCCSRVRSGIFSNSINASFCKSGSRLCRRGW